MRDASQTLQLSGEQLQRHPESMADLRLHRLCEIGSAAHDLAGFFSADATLTSEAIWTQPTAFLEFVQSPRQPLADAPGVAVGVV